MSLVPKHIKKLSPYIPGRTIDSVKKKYNVDRIIKLASNENPLGPSIQALDAVKKNLKESHRYPDSSGYVLREKLAGIFDLKIDNVILGSGSEGIMSAIMRTFLKQTDELISAENSFIGFRVLANASGVGAMLSTKYCPLVTLFGHHDATKFSPLNLNIIPISSQDYGSKNINIIKTKDVIRLIEKNLTKKT